MQRTTQKERKENAKTFIEILKKKGKNAIVIEKTYNDSNNVTMVKFITCNNLGKKMVIAESPFGMAFCMIEFIENIGYNGVQKDFFEPEFKEWFKKEIGYTIDYFDDLVMVLSCN